MYVLCEGVTAKLLRPAAATAPVLNPPSIYCMSRFEALQHYIITLKDIRHFNI